MQCHMQIAVQEDGETASEHTLDLRATHLHLGLLRISKRTTRKAPKRKQAGDAPEAKEEAQQGGLCSSEDAARPACMLGMFTGELVAFGAKIVLGVRDTVV